MRITSDHVIGHSAPAWRADSDFVAFCRLDEHGILGWWEQIWTKRLEEGYHQVCCIPFFTYGLALGDTVTVKDVMGQQTITGLWRKSGHAAVRVMADDKTQPGIHEALHRVVVPLGLPTEWQAGGYVAIDAATDSVLDVIRTAFQPLLDTGGFTFEVTGGRHGPPFVVDRT